MDSESTGPAGADGDSRAAAVDREGIRMASLVAHRVAARQL